MANEDSYTGQANYTRSELLVRYGFIKPDKLNNYELDKETGQYKRTDGKEISPEDYNNANEERMEIIPQHIDKTGYPEPDKTYNLSLENYNLSLEEPYFWVLDTLKGAFPNIEKVEDTFAAAENSAFFGLSQQRLGAQQDRVSTFLATTGKMIKELFQMVREMRILDERLDHYNASEAELEKTIDKRGRSAEITLKGMFVDLVQGGGKSPASIYGMAQQLEYITLPDLFFDSPPFKNRTELENHVKSLDKDFNRNVLRVLERHLSQFLIWKERTHTEHRNRRNFMLQYLLQHFDIIKMYITWLKPYLRHTTKLSFKQKNMSSADIVASFEGSMLDIELLAHKKTTTIKVGDNKVTDGHDCILVTFNYRTRPELKVSQEYQRGPVHIGRMEFNLRVYHWTKEEVQNYVKLKEQEIIYMMGDISETVQAAMTSLGKELDKYLEEARTKAGAKEVKKEEPKEEKKKIMEIFFGDFYTPSKKKKKKSGGVSDSAKAKAIADFKKGKKKGSIAFALAWATFHNFKKAHRMIAW